MPEKITREQRSHTMRQVRSANTSPEIIVRKLLHGMGFRFRLHDAKLPGKPDIILKKYGTVIFVHGCFWHRHKNCVRASTPVTNCDYWDRKFRLNVTRDRGSISSLKKLGLHVLVIWECETRNLSSLEKRLRKNLL